MFKVFPCGADKTPLISNWNLSASDDPAQLETWGSQFRDRLKFWGAPCGAINNIIALDVDRKNDVDGFKSLQDNNLDVPNTLHQFTINGGAHYIFQYPKDGIPCGNRVGVHPGIDIRSDNGYILLYNLTTDTLAPPPDWLLTATRNTFKTPQGEPIGVSQAVALNRMEECLQEIYEAPEGERNHTFNRQGFMIAQLVASGAVDTTIASDALRKVAVEIGLDNEEIKHTLNSCMRSGHQKPLTSPFGEPPAMTQASPTPIITIAERWTPPYFSLFQLTNKTKLKKPQLFKDWSTQDVHITTADGGTGKTTLKLYEAICLALGESFLGFECVNPGKTLFITGEDTADKLGAMVGAIAKQMGLMEDATRLNIILDSIVVKKDSNLCVIAKDKQNFLRLSDVSLEKIFQAVDDIKPKMIVFDPISMFWGSEAALNDMALAVSKFMGAVAERSNACVEMVNHMGKQSSSNRDMSQFAGRGGTGLPSHARVSRVLRPVDDVEYKELTGEDLPEKHSAMMCNVSKFSDGSPLYNKPFLIIRNGFLFERKDVEGKTIRDTKNEKADTSRVFEYIEEQRNNGKLPTKNVIIGHFMSQSDKLSKARTVRAIDMLQFVGHGVKSVRMIQDPDPSRSEKVFIITDHDGKEL